MYLEEILKDSFNEDRRVNISAEIIEYVSFANNIADLVESKEVLWEMIKKLNTISEEYRIKTNINKTKIVVIRRKEIRVHIKL